jgi:TPR repeat protein
VTGLLGLAERGDARAAFLLGMRYATGRDAEKDDSEAVRWLRVAAEAGLAEAQYNLGIMYATGRGVSPDLQAAARWYAAAADQELARAEYNLGALYGLGEGVQRDTRLAAKWFERAARHGVPEAQYNLGVLHELGDGVARDEDEARKWYRLAADSGYEPARSRLAALGAGSSEGLVSAPPPITDAEDESPPEAGSRSASPWLAPLPSSHYTLQLLSHTDETSVRGFVKKNFPGGGAGYFAFVLDGTTWFTVVYGVYPSYEVAKGAIDALDPPLRKLKPWVRKIAVIQKAAIR